MRHRIPATFAFLALTSLLGACGGAGGTGGEQTPGPDVPDILAFAPGSPWSGPTVQEAYVKASPSSASSRFGVSVAISGDTLVVGASNEHGVSGAVYVFERNGDAWTQQARLTASNAEKWDLFGASVAIDRDTIVVGAMYEDSAAEGVNGNPNDNSAEGAGAAYVFVRDGSAWREQAYLKASNTGAGDYFGCDVAISRGLIAVGAVQEDGSSTGVNGNQGNDGAVGSGAAYVFASSAGSWVQKAYLKASNAAAGDMFGLRVALWGDTLAVAAYGEDGASPGVNGPQSDDGALDSGAVYVFAGPEGRWAQQAYVKASDPGIYDGFGVGLALDGDTLAVGAPQECSSATGVNGNPFDNGASTSGAAYVFTRSAGRWTQQAYLKASNTGAGDAFGWSVDVSGDAVVVGAWLEDSRDSGLDADQVNNQAPAAGAAYVFARSGTTWTQTTYVKASNPGAGDHFGHAVAIHGQTVAAGAFDEDGAASGVNGNQQSETASDSGAVYVFR